MRLYKITTCVNSWKDVVGIQFTLATDAYVDDDSLTRERVKVKLGEIGKLEGDCETLSLRGSVEEVQVNVGGKYIANGIQGVAYIRAGRGKSYGNAGAGLKSWYFTEDTPLIGVYGKHEDYGIQKIGFITYDAKCGESEVSTNRLVTYITESDNGVMVAALVVLSVIVAIVAVVGIIAACILKRKELENIIVVERIAAEKTINSQI